MKPGCRYANVRPVSFQGILGSAGQTHARMCCLCARSHKMGPRARPWAFTFDPLTALTTQAMPTGVALRAPSGDSHWSLRDPKLHTAQIPTSIERPCRRWADRGDVNGGCRTGLHHGHQVLPRQQDTPPPHMLQLPVPLTHDREVLLQHPGALSPIPFP